MPEPRVYQDDPRRPQHAGRPPQPPPGYQQTQAVPVGWQPERYDPEAHRQRVGPRTPPAQPAPGPGFTPAPPRQQPAPGYQPMPQPRGYQQPQYAQPPPGQYPPQPRYAPQYQPPRRPRQRKPHRRLRISAWSAVGFLGLIALVAALSPGSSTPAPPAAAAGTPAAPASTAAAVPAAAKTVATFTGSGLTNTPAFTVTSNWRLDYSFDCTTFGQSGNFIILEDGTYGAMNVSVLAFTRSGSSYAYSDAGKHYLEVNSECAWTVKVIDEG